MLFQNVGWEPLLDVGFILRQKVSIIYQKEKMEFTKDSIEFQNESICGLKLLLDNSCCKTQLCLSLILKSYVTLKMLSG